MEALKYLNLLREKAWMLAIGTLAAAGAAAIVSLILPPVYQGQVSLLVRPSQPLASADPSVTALTSDQVSRTYATLMTEPPLLQMVITDLGLHTTPVELAKHIKVTPEPNTTIIDVAAESTDPAQARDIANVLVKDFIAQMRAIQQQESATPNAHTADDLVVVSPAVMATKPVSPNIPLNVAGAAFVGLVLAAGVALLLDYLDQSIKTDEELAERVGLIPIGHVPFIPGKVGRRGELVSLVTNSRGAEAYRAIRTNLMFAGLDRQLVSVLVTSANPGEGKSRTAANIAVVLAEAGHRTVLVDADFRRPSQQQIFGKVRNVGLANLLLQDMPESELVQQVEGIPNLWLVMSGPTPPNPSELLSSRRMKDLLARFQSHFTFVIIDSPPMNAVTDPAILASEADVTVLVVEAAKTTVPALQHAKLTLERVGARIAGPIVNKMRRDGRVDYYYMDAYTADQSAANSATGGDRSEHKGRSRRLLRRLGLGSAK